MQKKFLLIGLLIVLIGGYLMLNPTSKPREIVQSDEKCVIGGCSGQLCMQVIEGQENQIISTCEYKEEYACYKIAKCERQTDGKCGWTKTEELSSCLQEKKG